MIVALWGKIQLWLAAAGAVVVLGAAYPIVVGLGFALKAPVAIVEKLGVSVLTLWLAAYALTALM